MTPIDRSKYMDLREAAQLRTVSQARAIVDMAAGRMGGVVEWAVVDTAMQTGLRVSELAALKVGQVDLKRGCLAVTRRKRKKPLRETMAIGGELQAHLKQFIEWKGLVGQSTGARAALFVGRRGSMTVRGLQQLFKAALKRAGLPAMLSIHSARHTMAVHMLKRTGNLRAVQKALGHSSPAVTANFYADISFEDMQEAMTGLYAGSGK